MDTAQKDNFAAGSMDWIRTEAQRQIQAVSGSEVWTWIKDVFPQSLIVERERMEEGAASALLEVPYTVEGSTLSLGEPVEVGVEYVAKRRRQETPTELTGPIVYKNEAKRIAFAAVLVPGEPDSDGEVLTAEKIEDVAHTWLSEYQNMDIQHTLNNINAPPVESYLTYSDREIDVAGKALLLPQGTWILGNKHTEEIWAGIMDGSYTGFSVMGVARAAMKDAATKSEAQPQPRRTLLEDLGEDWVAPFVSVVDAPAVPKAKFFAIKSLTALKADGKAQSDTGISAALKRFFSGSQSGGQQHANKTEDTDMTAEEIKVAVSEQVGEALKSQLPEALKEPIAEALKAQAGTGDQGEADTSANKSADTGAADTGDTGESEELATFKSEVNDRLEKLTTAVKNVTGGASSKALESDEGDNADADDGNDDEDDGRDAWGRRRRG